MTKLILDLRKDATRNALLTQVTAFLNEQERASLEAKQESLDVPDKHHHTIHNVNETIDSLSLSEGVKHHAREIYQILAEAEAQAHNCSVDETHFHEVGNGPAIENTLKICLAFDALSPETIQASPVQTGTGKITCAHGELDIPAPATAAIIARGIPTCKEKLPGERCTPTSAAIILHYVDEFIPEESC